MSDETKNEMQQAADEIGTASDVVGAVGAADVVAGADTLDCSNDRVTLQTIDPDLDRLAFVDLCDFVRRRLFTQRSQVLFMFL